MDDREFIDTIEIDIGEDVAGGNIVWTVRFLAVDYGPYGVGGVSLESVATDTEVIEPAPWLAEAIERQIAKDWRRRNERD